MNFKLITTFPWWFILLCILLGTLISGLLYLKNRNTGFSNRVIWFLAFLRFLSVTVLAFLLLSPMLRTLKRNTVKPAIIIGIDNSSSVLMNSDSTYYKGEFINNISNLIEELGDNYDVHTFRFGEKIDIDEQPDYTDQYTDISSLFKEVNTRYYNRNIGAVILASDGIYNSGSDPLYTVRNSKYPVFTIKMGDSTSKKDIRIQNIRHNKTAIKGNLFPVEITLQAVDLIDKQGVVTITQNNSALFTKEIRVASHNQIITIPALIDAKEAGLMRLKVRVTSFQEEVNTANNERDIFIEVKENRIKIAVVTEAPHPDIAAMQRVMESSNNYDFEMVLIHEFQTKELSNYGLIVLNQVPTTTVQFGPQMQKILQSKVPVLFIVGSSTNIQFLNSLNIGLTLVNYKGSYNEVLPALNQSFSLFTLSDVQRKLIERLPPLISPMASYNIPNSAQIFANQTIGSTKTEMPLIFFNETTDSRMGVIAGEGIWKWRMYDFLYNSNHSNVDDLIGKIFQYLTAQTDKGKFRVEWNNFYAENETIEFNATLYNDSYELITDPEVTMEIYDEQNRKFDFTFSPGDKRYNLKIGTFSPGIYTFEAKANIPGEKVSKKGSFVVTSVKIEDVNTTADFKLLNIIASESGGQSYNAKDFSGISNMIKNRDDVKSVTYSRRNYMDLIDYFPLMLFLFVLLGLEWFLRKYLGSY